MCVCVCVYVFVCVWVCVCICVCGGVCSTYISMHNDVFENKTGKVNNKAKLI